MNPITKVLLTLLLSTITLFASGEAILKLDTQGHTGTTGDIITTKSGDIITCSHDKTIRVWDNKTGKEKRKVLGEIGKGNEGKIFAIALSPDEKQLAVGGYLSGKERSDKTAIRIYNYPTGKLKKVLKSHTSSVNDLSYSPDSKYLISGSSDKTAKIWNTETLKLIDTIKFHKNYVYAVKIVKKANTYLAITAGYDNQIAIYDIKKKKIIKNKRLNYKLHSLASSSKHIAVCGFGREILIYDYNLKLIKKITSKTEPYALSYSPNEKLLISGHSAGPINVNIYNIEDDYALFNSFKKHKDLVRAVTFLNNNTAITAGGTNSEIYIWDSKTGKVKRKIEGVGARVWSVGVKGDTIGWGNKFDAKDDWHKKQNSLQKTLNLKTFKMNNEKSIMKNMKRISTTKGDLTLSHTSGGDYGSIDGTLILKKNQKEIIRIIRDAQNGLTHRCYGFYKNNIISGGSNGALKIYNLKGEEVGNLIGHTGAIWSIALDGDRLVSGSSDQTIKIWDLSKLKINSEKQNFVDNSFFDKNWKSYIAKTYPNIDVSKKNDIKKLYKNLLKDYGNKEANKLIDKSIFNLEPQLTLFISKDNEWIVWSKSGYYNASANGDKYIGYHINQGSNKESYFVDSSKYYDTYYRPDIMQAILDTGSEKKAIEYVNNNRKVESVDVSNALPPMLSLFSASRFSTTKPRSTIRYKIESQSPVTQTIIMLNGKRVETRAITRKKKSEGEKSITIELESGTNIISVRAKNKHALSDEILVTIEQESHSENIFKPTLYLLSIGVSTYKDTSLSLGVADKDANAISQMFHTQKGKVYKDVKSKVLTNEQATQDNILDGLDWIDKEATSKDVVILFIAGHGVNDDKGNYYFLSHETDTERLRRTAIKWTEIEDTISSLPSKVILLADTCHSGNIAGGTRRDITSAIRSIINSGSGSIIMTATTGRGYSYERNEWGHGAFTKSILEGLGDMGADYDNDETITMKEMDFYVNSRVKELTNGKQKPTTIVPQSIPDFALGVR